MGSREGHRKGGEKENEGKGGGTKELARAVGGKATGAWRIGDRRKRRMTRKEAALREVAVADWGMLWTTDVMERSMTWHGDRY